MDLDLQQASPKFTVGLELATFLASSGILHKAWEEIRSASINKADTFVVKEYEDVVYVTFPSLYKEDFMVRDGRYGECNIQNKNTVFSASLKGDDDMPARVYEGALNRFLQESSNFEAQMERFLKSKKERAIIIVGHSVGGAVATLATLWVLEKRARHISPFSITFGSPLIGDARLGEAVGREDWSGKFCHVVSKYDIVPRMLLASFESITEPLNAIVPHWQSIMGIDSAAIQEARRTLLKNVLQCTSTIANNYSGESGHRSPYKPIGTYMFCSTQGAACIEDSEAALKMLHFTMQSKEGLSFDQIAGVSISEHTGYGYMLEGITEYVLSVNAMKVADFVSDSSFEMGTAKELEAMGIEAQNNHAVLALREAGYLKNKHDENIEKLNYELSKSQSHMAKLEWYKVRTCKNNLPGCYDVFKSLDHRRDFEADLSRLFLEKFWDEIIEKVKQHVLPSDFRSQNKWINAGTAYRRLVEPLDIADFYRVRRGDGSYFSNGARPLRHIVLEKWLREKDETRTGRDKKPRTKFASLTEDSCFWAHLEETRKTLEILQQNQDQVMNAPELKESLEKFEDYVWSMIKNRSISVEVFLEGSSFIIWWQQCRLLQLRSNPDLLNFIQNKGWILQD